MGEVSKMNKQQMLKYDDVRDRILIREWFKLKGVVLEHGSKYGVDLKGKEYDVEISHLSFDSLWEQWKKENRFRIEIRKRNHYWNGIYNKTHTTHFVQMNKSGHELLVYPEDLIMEYSNNEVELEYLRGFNLKERTFMFIPFDIGKDVIKRYEI
jgi:sulfatase maturation enzyme AslB (radical SAM superfamily)